MQLQHDLTIVIFTIQRFLVTLHQKKGKVKVLDLFKNDNNYGKKNLYETSLEEFSH